MFSDLLCQDNQTCSTPLQPGVYGGEKTVEYIIQSDFPHWFEELFGSGTWRVEFEAHDENQVLTCFYLEVEIEITNPKYDELQPNITNHILSTTESYTMLSTTPSIGSLSVVDSSLIFVFMLIVNFATLVLH